ncbi:hypothetical protein Tco_1218452 [Tanacetum coccineum]
MAELISEEYLVNAQNESNLSITSNNINIELDESYVELQKSVYHGWIDEDVVNHIAKVLEMIDLIYIPGVDSHQLRMKVFPLLLADDVRQWWINEKERKITIWEELVEKFFCKFYPESYDGEEEMLDEGNNSGIDPLEFISRVNSLFDKHMKMDGRTKKVNMDDPNITMEEYIRLEEEKARRRGKGFNLETAKNGKIWYDEDVHDIRSVETEFPAIVFNDTLTSKATLSCEPMVSSLNDNEIYFRTSFDESDDEDYTVIYDKNSFSYKIIFVNDLKMDSENNNEKVNMPSFPSPEPTVSYFDDLDFFKNFNNEFPAIVYNDAQTSKLDFLTAPTVSPQHIDEFDLNDETSLSEYDEVEQNVLYFNDLFPFNIVYPDDSKSDKNNDKIDIK